jgi:predicted AlkP superfamily phosphohydrolase/phosphomutase
MLWRQMEAASPAGAPRGAAQDRIENLYANMDSLLGVVAERIPRDAVLIVMSDHGFAPYRKKFNLNTWLYQNGYLSLTRPDELGRHPLLGNVSWRRTRAYALGINGLYLNVLNRESKGIVRRGPPYDDLRDEISAKLLAVRDPESGERVITRVDRPSDVYHGPETANAPDLIIGYNRGYRGSDDSALGTLAPAWLTPNHDKWSGDHCMDHTLVPGVLLINRPLAVRDPSLLDLSATILALYGIRTPGAMRGRTLITP